MDFSSNERALISLQKRQPPLSEEIQTLSSQLLNVSIHDTLYTTYITQLLLPESSSGSSSSSSSSGNNNKARWEPLAVGLHLTASYLEQMTTLYKQSIGCNLDDKDQQVFMDGPRVPTLQDNATTPHDGTDDDGHGHGSPIIPMEQLLPFSQTVIDICQTHLEHNEPRVRTLVAKVLGQHAQLGIAFFFLHPTNTNTTTTTTTTTTASSPLVLQQSVKLYQTILDSLHEHVASGPDTENKSKSSSGALDDTTGWRALETNLYGIGSFINAAKQFYFPISSLSSSCAGVEESVMDWKNDNGLVVMIPQDKFQFLDLKLLQAVEYCSITHVNRHVRAAAIALLEQLVHACASSSSSSSASGPTTETKNDLISSLLMNTESKLRTTIISVLKTTLSDNWSQVRMAASVLCRVFFVTILDYAEQHAPLYLQDESIIHTWLKSLYPILLPRMCLNRFYLAQGVKLYSHETWRILFDRSNNNNSSSSSDGHHHGGGGGLESIALNAGAVCRYYVQMCDADNHAVREAACQAVAELATKIGKDERYAHYLAPYVPMLLQALLMCFHDESWPVRDEACLACGTFCLAYPQECEPELNVLFTRWTEQLTDQIWSVREDAAVALGDAIEAYGSTLFEQVLSFLRKNIPSAKEQPPMSREEYKRRQNDIESHTNSQLYSCGSLAPKLRKGGAGRIGCSDCQLTRPKAPWEATDGCIYLIRELCVRLIADGSEETNSHGIVFTDDLLLPIMTELIDVCRLKHFPQSDELRTTLWKQLPVIARSVGKQRFKKIYLQLFIEMLIDNLDSHNDASQLSVHAAGQCAEELANLVGVSIFRGRLEDEWHRDVFDRVMRERSMAAKSSPMHGPTVEDGFSPFGPPGMILTRGRGDFGGPGVFGTGVSSF